MGTRAKIFSLIAVCLLVVPVLLNPPSSRQVLGITDTVKASSEKPQSTSSAKTVEDTKTVATPTSNNSAPQATSSKPTNNSVPNQSTKTKSEQSTKKTSRFSLSLPKLNINLPKFNTNSTPTVNQQEIYNVRDITSGVREKADKIFPQEYNQENSVSGQIYWEPSETKKIITNKFDTGNSLQVQTPSQVNQVVVTETKALPLNTVLVVDQDTFREIGGNPENQQFINATIFLNQ